MTRRNQRAPVGSGEERHRLAVYHATDSDAVAAAELDVPWYVFRDWRRRLGLPAKGSFVGPLAREIQAKRLAAWQHEPFPAKAAALAGCSSDAMQAWARGEGLPTVAEHVAMLRDGLSDKDLRHWEAYCRFRTDFDAGRSLGATMSSFRRWRIRQRLPGHCHTPAFYEAIRAAAKAGNPVAADFLRRHPQPRPAKLRSR